MVWLGVVPNLQDTSIDMLSSVRDVLEGETEHLVFDYSSMYRRMFRLFHIMAERLRKVMIYDSPQSFSGYIIEVDCFNDTRVCLMLMIVLNSPRHMSQNPQWLSDHAVEIIEEYLLREGNLGVKKAREAFASVQAILPQSTVNEVGIEKKIVDEAERERRQRKNKLRNEKRKQKKRTAGFNVTQDSEQIEEAR